MRRYRPLLLSVAALITVGFAGCGDETATQPNPPTDQIATSPEFAVTSNTWITRANMPSDRWHVVTATVADATGATILYAIGGLNAPYGSPLGKVQAYNAATNSWTTKASLPHVVGNYGTARINGAQTINGKIYVPGGAVHWYSTAYLQVYNPATNTWVDKAPMAEPASGGVSGVINGKLYVLAPHIAAYFIGFTFQRYDPTTDKWTRLPLPPAGHVSGAAAGVLNKKFYVTGGGDPALHVYDPATNVWTKKSKMPLPRNDPVFAVLNNKLFIAGGVVLDTITHTSKFVGRVDVYDPATNGWTQKKSIPRTEWGLAGGRVVVNGQARLEVIGGLPPGNNLQYVP